MFVVIYFCQSINCSINLLMSSAVSVCSKNILVMLELRTHTVYV